MEAAAAVKLPSSAMAFMTRSPAASIMERSYNVTLSAVSTVQLRVMTHKARPRHHLHPRTVREGRRNDEGRTAQRSGPRRWTPTNGVALELALLVAARDAELVVRVEDLDVARRQVRDDDGDLLLVVQAGGVEARLVDRVALEPVDVVARVVDDLALGNGARGEVARRQDLDHPVVRLDTGREDPVSGIRRQAGGCTVDHDVVDEEAGVEVRRVGRVAEPHVRRAGRKRPGLEVDVHRVVDEVGAAGG